MSVILAKPARGTGTGSRIVSELVSSSTSGSNVTIDLTTLANSFSVIVGVYRNGNKLVNRANDGSSSSWTRSVNTMTVYNCTTSDDYQIDYTY